MFSYGEAFFTPRLFAESLCILCIGRLARGRWLSAAAYLLRAGLLHPLQAFADGRARENRMLPLLQESKRCMQESRRNPAGRTSYPDYIVLPYTQPETALGEWRVPSLLSAQEAVTFRIYACRDLLRLHANL